MGMLMGVNIQTADSMGSDGGSSAAPPPAKKKAPEPEPEPVPLTPEEEARKAKKAEADVHKVRARVRARARVVRQANPNPNPNPTPNPSKDAGNVAYRAKSFEEAIGHYEKVTPNPNTEPLNLSRTLNLSLPHRPLREGHP